MPTYAKTKMIKKEFLKFDIIKKITLKKTTSELQHAKRFTLTCNIDFYITDEENRF